MSSRITFLVLGTIIFVHTIVLTKLILFPYPELFIYPYLTNHGLKPYSQILDQHFPGLLFLPLNFDNLGMNNEVIARIWLIGIIFLTQLLLFFIASKIFKNNKKALLVNFLYLIWQPFFEGWVLWIDSLLPLILLPAFYFLYRRSFFIAGFFLGMGVVFKQTLIPLALLVFFYVTWQERKKKELVSYSLGLFIPVILMILYLLSIGVIKDFWYWTIVFNLTTYARYGTSIPSSLGFITRILVVYLPTLFILLNKDKRSVFILGIFLSGSLAGVFDRANFVHFQPSLPFAILATIIGVDQLRKNRVLKISIICYLIISCWWLNIFYKGHIGKKVFFFDEQTKLIASKIKQYTNINDKIFVFGAPPHLYQMADRLPAGNIFVFQFPWFLKVAKDRILDGIKIDRPKIIVADRTMEIEQQKIIDYAKDIDQYIQKNYKVIDSVGTTQILQLKLN